MLGKYLVRVDDVRLQQIFARPCCMRVHLQLQCRICGLVREISLASSPFFAGSHADEYFQTHGLASN